MTRLGTLVKVSFSLQLMTVRAGSELDEDDFSVDDPAQALIDLREQIGLQDVFAGAGGDQMLLGEEHQLVAYPGSQIEVM